MSLDRSKLLALHNRFELLAFKSSSPLGAVALEDNYQEVIDSMGCSGNPKPPP